jgi:hypothetical protein
MAAVPLGAGATLKKESEARATASCIFISLHPFLHIKKGSRKLNSVEGNAGAGLPLSLFGRR